MQAVTQILLSCVRTSIRVAGLLVVALNLNTVSMGDEAHTIASAPVSVPKAGDTFDAVDSLDVTADPIDDANDCLNGLRWRPGKFQVECEPASDDRADLLIRFPSPLPSGDATNDNVSMELYLARDDQKNPVRSKCVIVVHESGRGMTVGRIFARGLAAQGLHTCLVHMPGYGARRSELTNRPEFMLTGMKQAIADVRRARDVVPCLPFVDSSVVGLQGTSLGGFVCSTVAGLDRGYDRVFILLAGGNLHTVVENGTKDAAKFRERLAAAGITGDKVRELARPVEPLRLAHRINANQTWVYSGKYDDVVPPASSKALVDAAKLPEGHHIELSADHYSGVIFLPAVMNEIRQQMDSTSETKPTVE